MITAFFGSLRNYVPDFQLETPSTWTAPQIRAVAVVYVGHFRVLPDVQLQGPRHRKACFVSRDRNRVPKWSL